MSRKRVLIIDNDRFSLLVLHRLVSELGHEPMIGTVALFRTLTDSRPLLNRPSGRDGISCR